MCQSRAEGGLRCVSHTNKRLSSTYDKFIEEFSPLSPDSQEAKTLKAKIIRENKTVSGDELAELYGRSASEEILSSNFMDRKQDKARIPLQYSTPFAIDMLQKAKILYATQNKQAGDEIKKDIQDVLYGELLISNRKKALANSKPFQKYQEKTALNPENESIYRSELKEKSLTDFHSFERLQARERIQQLIFKKYPDVSQEIKKVSSEIKLNDMIKLARNTVIDEKIKQDRTKPSVQEAYEAAIALESPSASAQKFIAAFQEQKINELTKENETIKDFIRIVNSKSQSNNDVSKRINKPSLALLANNYKGNGEFKKPLFASKEYKQATEKMSEIIKLYPEGFKTILGK